MGLKEGIQILFNAAFNTFYLWFFGFGHMVIDHSDSEKGNLLPALYVLCFLISSKVFFLMHHSTDRMTHSTTFVISVVEQ